MPAKKTARAQERKRIINRTIRSSTRTSVKKAVAAIESGDAEQAKVTVASAVSALDRAATKSIVHKNNASRRKSRLMKRLNTVAAA
ncbi:MAG: 30S ribosomal protein S20 [Chloroflexi bacterium]|nr:30S ribosomal protein S20 [Chloroflexota bacterium]